jgi:hypothetical protein
MLKNINKTYEYRYIRHDARVYYIGRNVHGPFQNRMFYTEPFTSREQNVTRNAIIGFLSPELVVQRVDQIMSQSECDVNLVDVPIGDLKQMAHVLKMPLVVELYKSVCPMGEVVNIYYYLPDTQNNKLKM